MRELIAWILFIVFACIAVVISIAFGVTYAKLKKEKDELQTSFDKLTIANKALDVDKTKLSTQVQASTDLSKQIKKCTDDLTACGTDKTKCGTDLGTCNAGKTQLITDLGTCDIAKNTCETNLETCEISNKNLAANHESCQNIKGELEVGLDICENMSKPYSNYRVPSGYCVDVAGGSKLDNAIVTAWDCGIQDNQFYVLDKVTKQLRAKHSGMCIATVGTADASVKQMKCTTNADQKWTKTSNADGTFTLVNDGNAKCLTIPTSKGADVTASTCIASASQKLANNGVFK